MERDQRRGRRARGDDGAALIEAAIVLPFLVLLVFGIVELGFLFRSASVAVGASRSGARIAAANYGSALDATQQSTVLSNVQLTVESELQSKAAVDTPVEMWVYKAKADGTATSDLSGNFTTCGANCIKFSSWSSSTKKFTAKSGSWGTVTACGTSKDRIGVYVKMTHTPLGFSSVLGTLTIGEHAVMLLEPPNPNTCPQGS
jgi:Flp pilus assembly protein TadG